MLATVDCIAVVGTAMGNPVRLLPGRQLITQLLHVAILGSNPPHPHLLIAMVINRTVGCNYVTRHLDRHTCNVGALHRQSGNTHIY